MTQFVPLSRDQAFCCRPAASGRRCPRTCRRRARPGTISRAGKGEEPSSASTTRFPRRCASRLDAQRARRQPSSAARRRRRGLYTRFVRLRPGQEGRRPCPSAQAGADRADLPPAAGLGGDAARRARAGMPERVSFATKPELGLAMLKRALAAAHCPEFHAVDLHRYRVSAGPSAGPRRRLTTGWDGTPWRCAPPSPRSRPAPRWRGGTVPPPR